MRPVLLASLIVAMMAAMSQAYDCINIVDYNQHNLDSMLLPGTVWYNFTSFSSTNRTNPSWRFYTAYIDKTLNYSARWEFDPPLPAGYTMVVIRGNFVAYDTWATLQMRIYYPDIDVTQEDSVWSPNFYQIAEMGSVNLQQNARISRIEFFNTPSYVDAGVTWNMMQLCRPPPSGVAVSRLVYEGKLNTVPYVIGGYVESTMRTFTPVVTDTFTQTYQADLVTSTTIFMDSITTIETTTTELIVLPETVINDQYYRLAFTSKTATEVRRTSASTDGEGNSFPVSTVVVPYTVQVQEGVTLTTTTTMYHTELTTTSTTSTNWMSNLFYTTIYT